MLRPRGRHRRSLAVLTSALLGGLALVLTPPAAKAQAAPPTRPTGPPTSQALHRLLLAVPRTVSTTAAVGYRLVGATVLGTAPQPVVGGGAFDLLHGVGRATLDQPSGSELVVLTPTIVFSKVPRGGAAALPKGKTWLSASLVGSESVATNFPQFDVQVEAFNPLLYLDEVAWGALRAAPLGPSLVGGAPATGYAVTTDLTKALRAASGPSAASMSLAIRSELADLGSGPGTVGGPSAVLTVHLWVDTAGRVVMIEASPPGAGVGRTWITLSRFGVAVRASPPRVSKVVDIAQLTPSGERENNGHGDADGA